MKKIKTLKKNYEFRKVFQKGKIFSSKNIKVFISKNNIGENRIGIAVSVKADKAVKRNRIKRLIRENYRLISSELKKGYNIVFLWNKNSEIDEMSFEIIKKDIINVLKKADMFKE